MTALELEGTEYKGFVIATNPIKNCDWWEVLIIKGGKVLRERNYRTQLQGIEYAKNLIDKREFS